MNKAVELINEWGAFDAGHPQGSIEDFCRYYLAHQRQKGNNDKLPSGRFLPVSTDGVLMRLVGRIFKLHSIYTAAAMEETGIDTVDEYSLLNTIQQLNEPRKTEAIYASLQELSTGTDKLNKLIKLGYVTEYDDKEDKRARRLKVTPKGEKVLVVCRKRMSQLAAMMLHDISEDDKRLCFQLLRSVETKFEGLWQSHKGQPFDEVYKELVAG